MGAIYDRMKYAGPLWKAMRDPFASMIRMANAMRGLVMGLNPHLVDDSTNTAAAADIALDSIEEVRDASQALYVAYEAHRASGTYHTAADETNTLSAVPTPKATYDLLNQIKAKYNAHRVLTAGGVHGEADSVNAVATADADTKAKAIALANALRTAYEAHRVVTDPAVHGAADATNVVTVAALASTATWVDIAALADNLRTKYEAHRILTAESVHGAADNTNSMSVTAVGTVLSRDYLCINGLKEKFNLHIILGTSHAVIDKSVKITSADGSTEATAVALTRELILDYRKHISRATYLSDYPALEEI